MIMKLRIGDKAPDFRLPATFSSSVCLSDFLGKNVVLAFFPLAFTNI
jgi:peroxiredoxin